MIEQGMPHLTRTIHCFAADDAGRLAVASVTDTPLGAKASLIEAIPGALEMPAGQLASKLPTIRKGDGIVFVCPSSLASPRPFALTVKNWPGAKDDVLASVATLFALTPDDARVGLLDLAKDDADEAATPKGVLVAASAAALRPWLEHLHAATGHTPGAVLAPAQCLPALGLRDEHSRVLEAIGPDETVEHTLRFGEPTDIASSPTHDDPAPARTLPGATASGGSGAISLAELALAGALTPTVAGARTAPVQGAMPAPRSRWVLPAACVLVAGVLMWFALRAPEARTQALLREIDAREQQIAPDARRVSALRDEARTLHTLLDGVIAPTINPWTPALPDLQAARDAMPEGVWLYDISLTQQGIEINGVAPDARAVLRAIESSRAFTGASFGMPPAPVPDRAGERFRLVAQRTSLGQRGAK